MVSNFIYNLVNVLCITKLFFSRSVTVLV